MRVYGNQNFQGLFLEPKQMRIVAESYKLSERMMPINMKVVTPSTNVQDHFKVAFKNLQAIY